MRTLTAIIHLERNPKYVMFSLNLYNIATVYVTIQHHVVIKS